MVITCPDAIGMELAMMNQISVTQGFQFYYNHAGASKYLSWLGSFLYFLNG